MTTKEIKQLVTEQSYISYLVISQMLKMGCVRDFLRNRGDLARLQNIADDLFGLFREICDEIDYNELFGVNELH